MYQQISKLKHKMNKSGCFLVLLNAIIKTYFLMFYLLQLVFWIWLILVLDLL